MSERERLAAALEDGWFGGASDAMPDPWHDLADRLIALGWTRLDEERLARALLVTQGYTLDTHRHVYGDDVDIIDAPHEWFDSTRNLAAAIAKAYREDEG